MAKWTAFIFRTVRSLQVRDRDAFFVGRYEEIFQRLYCIFHPFRTGALAVFGNADYGVLLLGQGFLSFEFDRVFTWRDFADLYRQREFRRANYDYDFQYPVRNYLYKSPLLRRNDHLSVHESTCRGIRLYQLAEKSVQTGQTRSQNRLSIHPKMVNLYRACGGGNLPFVFRFTVF